MRRRFEFDHIVSGAVQLYGAAHIYNYNRERERPRCRKKIATLGLRPYMVWQTRRCFGHEPNKWGRACANCGAMRVWDGYNAVDTSGGKSSHNDSLQKQMRKMIREGLFPEALPPLD